MWKDFRRQAVFYTMPAHEMAEWQSIFNVLSYDLDLRSDSSEHALVAAAP